MRCLFLILFSFGTKCYSQNIFANIVGYITYSTKVGQNVKLSTPLHYSMQSTTTTDSGTLTNCTLYFTAVSDTIIRSSTDLPPVPNIKQLGNIYVVPLWQLDSVVCDDKTTNTGIYMSN